MIEFPLSELTEFFRILKNPDRIEFHLKSTIENTRNLGIKYLKSMVEQGSLTQSLFYKMKLAVENPQLKIVITN